MLAIQGFGENTCRCRFSYASHAGKDVGLSDSVVFNRIHQGFNDMFLAYHPFECHRPVFSGKNHITHVNLADECFEGSRVPYKLNNILS
jgi:hypothetical protein